MCEIVGQNCVWRGQRWEAAQAARLAHCLGLQEPAKHAGLACCLEQALPTASLSKVTGLLRNVQDGGVLLVATTRENVSPSLVLELLRRIGGIIKVRQHGDGDGAHLAASKPAVAMNSCQMLTAVPTAVLGSKLWRPCSQPVMQSIERHGAHD